MQKEMELIAGTENNVRFHPLVKTFVKHTFIL